MANFINGSTGAFMLLQGGARTEFQQNEEFVNSLSDQGKNMYMEAQNTLSSYYNDYKEAESLIKELEVSGLFMDKYTIYDVDSIQALGSPNYAMSHWIAAHPYYGELNREYGHSYPFIEEGSEDMLDVLRNVADEYIIKYDEVTGEEYYTLTSDSVKDVGFKKLKWKDKLTIASTHQFLDICQEYGVDIFEEQFKENEYE